MDDQDYEILKGFTLVLERSSFDEMRDYLEKLSVNEEAMLQFHGFLYNLDLLGALSKDKNDLAMFVTQACKLSVLPEDRMRIVYFLAQSANDNLTHINQVAAKEFGPGFKIFQNYNTGRTAVTWQQVLKKAKEIINGFYIHDRLQVENYVQEIITYFQLLKVQDQSVLQEIVGLADDIANSLGQNIYRPPGDFEMKPIHDKVVRFYQLCQRASFDIEKIDNEINFENILHFIHVMKYACAARLHLLVNNQPGDNVKSAYDFLSVELAYQYSHIYIGADELERMKKPLLPINKGAYVR